MKESLLTDLFLQAGFFLALSALVIPLLKYFKIPTGLGYLLAGIALGPYALGALATHYPLLNSIGFNDAETIKILAELGIVLLLFVIGLELTPARLWQMRHLVFGLGGAQVIVTSIVIGSIAYAWGNSPTISLLLGLGLSLSSTALVIQWLQEKRLFATDMGRTSFSILLFQDIAIIPILLLLTILSTDLGDNIVQFVSLSLVKMVFTTVALFVVGKIILKPVFLFANRYGGSEVFMALSLLVIVVSATVASLAGLSIALGAFIAGLLLADTEYRHEIYALIMPFKSILLGLFFVSFGMGIDLAFIAEKPLWLFASVVGLMTTKALLLFGLCKLWKQSTAVSVESAILMSQSGEFGLLIVGSALTVGLMDAYVGQFMLIVVGITMMLTPLIAPLAKRIRESIEARCHTRQDYDPTNAPEQKDHAVIFGFGRVGKMVANSLCSEGYSILAFDNDIEKVSPARSESYPVYLGDGTKKNTINAAQLEEARCVVITTDNETATQHIVSEIRKINDIVPIIVRAQTREAAEEFNKHDNITAIAENLVISEKLSNKALNFCEDQHAL